MALRDTRHRRNTRQPSATGPSAQSPQGRLDIIILMVTHKKRLETIVPTGLSESLEAETAGVCLKG